MTRHIATGQPTGVAKRPSIALALGGGGARGLAHVAMLEAFDELGVRPSLIAGTSIGAIFGAAYAAGLSAKEIRAHLEDVLLSRRIDIVRELFSARVRGSGRLMQILSARSALLDPVALLDWLLPSRMPRHFAQLATPLKVVATDFYAQEPVVFADGDLLPAVAASMALPALFQPVAWEGKALVDGGLTNPLPFDLLAGQADLIVAIDVSGAPIPSADRAMPTAAEALFASAFIWERSLIKEKLKIARPDVYIDAGTSHFQVLDFLKTREILAAAEPGKARLKAQLERILSSETLPDANEQPDEKPRPTGRARGLIKGKVAALRARERE